MVAGPARTVLGLDSVELETLPSRLHTIDSGGIVWCRRRGARAAASRPAKATQEEIISINTDARHIALQVALLIPILAGLLGLLNSFRMVRIPEPKPSSSLEGMALG